MYTINNPINWIMLFLQSFYTSTSLKQNVFSTTLLMTFSLWYTEVTIYSDSSFILDQIWIIDKSLFKDKADAFLFSSMIDNGYYYWLETVYDAQDNIGSPIPVYLFKLTFESLVLLFCMLSAWSYHIIAKPLSPKKLCKKLFVTRKQSIIQLSFLFRLDWR